MARSKKIKISFEIDKSEFDKLYEQYFTELVDMYCDEYGDDDGEEEWVDPKDRARDDVEDMTESDIVKDFLWTKI
jgi:hypothetical protein